MTVASNSPTPVARAEPLNQHMTCATFDKRDVPVGTLIYARAEAQDEQPDIKLYTEDLKGLKTAMQAKAQDEGAAGEWERIAFVQGYEDGFDDAVAGHDRDPVPSFEAHRAAHPSPTPAADADRVRTAMRELIDADKELAVAINFAEPTENNDALTRAEYRAQAARNQAEQALAALKSTAAKEGGA